MFNLFKSKRKVALALGGGSARGIAHIGVLKVIEKEKIPIDLVVGTSMGALIGAAWATGMPTADMEKKANAVSINKLLDPSIPRIGLLAGDKMESVIKDLVDHKTFDDCRIPFAAVTTDIETAEEVVHQTGELPKIVRASCSWPGIFNPVRIEGKLLVDGGIKNSVPTKIARSLGADYVIAVDVGFCVRDGRITNIFQMILQSFQITGEELNKYQSVDADFIIKVNLGSIDQLAFNKSKESIRIGEEAASLAMAQLKKDLRL